MSTVKEFISKTFDGKYVGDARNTFEIDAEGVVHYVVRGTDINRQPFEARYKGPGFLLEVTPRSETPGIAPRRRLEFRMHPVRETGSLEEILYGVASSPRTDVEALGVAKIVEVAANGRGKVKTLWGDEAKAALEQLGYPDLIDDLRFSEDEYR